jgi:hypothetical protein
MPTALAVLRRLGFNRVHHLGWAKVVFRERPALERDDVILPQNDSRKAVH